MNATLAAFGWSQELAGDLPLDAFVQNFDLATFPWDQVVWWNTELARSAVLFAENKATGGSVPVISEDLSVALSQGNDASFELLMTLAGRVPRSHVHVTDRICAAVFHVLKANRDVTGAPVYAYDPVRGVWLGEGKLLSNGQTVSGVLDYVIEQFARGMHRAVDFVVDLERIFMTSFPEPVPVNPNAPTAAEKRAKRIWDAQKKAVEAAHKEAHEMARGLSRKEQSRVRSMIKQRISVEQTEWDSNTRWLILRDGVLDLEGVAKTGKKTLYSHHPKTMSTMALNVGLGDAVRNAGRSEWDLGVEKVLPVREVREYLQKRFGAALLGDPKRTDKSMVWQHGTGDTAKSTIQECIAGSAGVFAPYSYAASSEVLMRRNGMNPASERFKAYARGKRFVIMSEINAGDKLDRALFTSLTGGDTIEGTAKFSNAVSYEFTATIFMATNDAPTYPPGDTTFVERIHVVPFRHKLWSQTKNPAEWAKASPEHRADPDWRHRVLSSPQERAAILHWVLDGLVLWSEEGFKALPAEMLEAREEFSEGADPVKDLVDSLLGEGDSELPAMLAILSDEEWESVGYSSLDAATSPQVMDAINRRALEMSIIKFGESKLSPAYMSAAKKLLDERGGMYKAVRGIKADGSSGTQKRWSRVKMLPAGVGPYGY